MAAILDAILNFSVKPQRPDGRKCKMIAKGIYFQNIWVYKIPRGEGAVVKGRNEPHNIRQVLEIIAAVKELENMEELAEQIYDNTTKIFYKSI